MIKHGKNKQLQKNKKYYKLMQNWGSLFPKWSHVWCVIIWFNIHLYENMYNVTSSAVVNGVL